MSKFHATEFDFYPARAFTPRPGGGMTFEGGKSSGSTANDPMLQLKQTQSLDQQNRMAQQMLDNSNELAPLQRQALQQGLDSSRTAYAQSQEDRQYALGRRDKLDAAQAPLLAEAANFNEG